MKIKIIQFELIFGMILLFNCNASPTPTYVSPPALTDLPKVHLTKAIPTNIISNTPSEVTKNRPIIFTTPSPVKPATLYPTPSISPLPKLSIVESKKVVEKLLTSDAFCRLPCFGNIIPGETLWTTAKRFFETFANDIYDPHSLYDVHTISLSPPERLEKGNVENVFHTDYKGRVDLIFTFRYHYPLQQFLIEYGIPTEIYIYVSNLGPAYGDSYQLILLYKDQGILASYEGFPYKGFIYRICPSKLNPPLYGPVLWLSSPKDNRSFESYMDQLLFDFHYTFGLHEMDLYNPLEKNTKMTVRNFFDTFSDPVKKNTCFDVPNPYNTPDPYLEPKNPN